MERVPRGWLAAIALTAVGVGLGATPAPGDRTVFGSDRTVTPVVLLGGLVTVLAAQAVGRDPPLT